MENLVLTEERAKALHALIAKEMGNGGARFDAKLPDEYRDQAFNHARNFDARTPNASIEGVSFDSADPNWNFCLPGFSHFDDASSIFVARQLEFIRAGVYAKRYPQLKWSTLFPANYNVDTGAESMTVQGTDVSGEPTISKIPQTHVNSVKLRTFEGSMGFFSMQLKYEYTIQEVRNAMFARVPLTSKLAVECRNLMERKLDDIAFLGDSTASVKGALTLSGTLTYSTPATGAGGSKSWDDKTPADILLDLNAPIDKVVVDSNEVEYVNRCLLPTSRKRKIQTTRIGDGSDVTIERFFLLNQEFVKQIDTTYKSESNSAWTGKRGMFYCYEPECFEMVIPQPFEQFQPVVHHSTVSTMTHLRTGGIALYRPKSVIYLDEI